MSLIICNIMNLIIGAIGVALSILFTWFVFCFLPEWVHDLKDKSKLKNGTKELWSCKRMLDDIINYFRIKGYEMRLDQCEEHEDSHFFILYDSMRIHLKIPKIVAPTEEVIKGEFDLINVDIFDLIKKYKKYNKTYMMKNYYKQLKVYECLRNAIVDYYLQIGEERKAKRWKNNLYINFQEMFFNEELCDDYFEVIL